jgi:hypothetical protein
VIAVRLCVIARLDRAIQRKEMDPPVKPWDDGIEFDFLRPALLAQGYFIVPSPLRGGGLGWGCLMKSIVQHPPLNPLPSREGDIRYLASLLQGSSLKKNALRSWRRVLNTVCHSLT